jgi:DHA1 family bicyclomycin/chloramphenicol resistance-like MFS transporter
MGCVLAGSIESLLFFRVLSAIGGSATTVGANTMVRDYFPQKEVAKILSLLILVLSISPFLAPSVGSLIVLNWHWRAVFPILSLVALFDAALVTWALPVAYQPDPTVSLNLKPVFSTFRQILKNRHFTVYTLTGSLSFAGLFVFVAGSPSIFFGEFGVSPKKFSLIFAVLIGGIIGGSQLNHVLVKRFGSAKILKVSLTILVLLSSVFLAGSLTHSYNLVTTGGFLFFLLALAGVASPNAAALALEPFSKNIGSAAALLGFLQEGFGGVIAAVLGILNGRGTLPTSLVMWVAPVLGLGILLLGSRSPKTSP